MVTEICPLLAGCGAHAGGRRIHPERVFTDRIGLADGLRGYERVMSRELGVLKVLMHPV